MNLARLFTRYRVEELLIVPMIALGIVFTIGLAAMTGEM
jgi:hypothetical protein